MQKNITIIFVSPAYGHVKSALVKCNMKENPGTSILVMKVNKARPLFGLTIF